jgi:hypothetical protein
MAGLTFGRVFLYFSASLAAAPFDDPPPLTSWNWMGLGLTIQAEGSAGHDE